MNDDVFTRLEDVIVDPLFPEIDIDLRQGRHISRDEAERYGFLLDAGEYLSGFYARYGCELRHAPDGYFYLLPNGGGLRRRQLSAGEMLVGQVLTLLYLAPESVQNSGITAKNQIVGRLAALVGEERLVRALGRGRKRSERVAEESVRDEAEKGVSRAPSTGIHRARGRRADTTATGVAALRRARAQRERANAGHGEADRARIDRHSGGGR